MRRPLTGLVLAGALLAAALGGPAPGPAAATVPASTTASTPAPVACPAPAARTLFRTPATSPRTVALTFDDGPGPWTPYVLAVLRRERVHATFFVTGTHVTADPATVRSVVGAGHRLGNHTWSHPQLVAGSVPYGDFDRLAEAEQVRQLDAAGRAILLATHTRACFFRAPGGHDASPVTARLTHARRLSVVRWSVSSGDSAQPGHRDAATVAAIVRRATHRPGRHPVLLMHDGKASHEPRRQVSAYRGNTVAALPRIIGWYRAHGYVFTDPAGRPFAGDPTAQARER